VNYRKCGFENGIIKLFRRKSCNLTAFRGFLKICKKVDFRGFKIKNEKTANLLKVIITVNLAFLRLELIFTAFYKF
jgi:hypothetical protein